MFEIIFNDVSNSLFLFDTSSFNKLLSGNSGMMRKKEVNSTLNFVVDNALDNAMNKKTYTIDDSDELVADVVQQMLYTYENDAEITIEIAEADENSGLLSLNVTENYTNPDGTQSSNSYEKSVMLDTESSKETYSLIYYNNDGSFFKCITVNRQKNGCVPETMPAGMSKWMEVIDQSGNITDISNLKDISISEIQNNKILENHLFVAMP